jgi:2-oxoglutarate ferredoxin oxidoreductase subunit beta
VISACYEHNLAPDSLMKISGIGCSSKTPAYFLSRSFSFNGCHGRMPGLATGAHLANRTLHLLAVSGDGDTASIGAGQFIHLMRRNLDMTYIVENNGTYGLTKGQFSATSYKGAKAKRGAKNPFEAIDICETAIMMGATYVARSFSGDQKQLVPLIKGALSHRGIAVIDVYSPCVTFFNNEGSHHSYDDIRASNTPVHGVDWIESKDEIKIDYDAGTMREVKLHDGSVMMLKKLAADWQPRSRAEAITAIIESREQGHLLTGLLYRPDEVDDDLATSIRIPETPLAKLTQAQTRPAKSVLDEINDSFR